MDCFMGGGKCDKHCNIYPCRERRSYNQALDDFITEIERQTTVYCGKDSYLRQILEQLKR